MNSIEPKSTSWLIKESSIEQATRNFDKQGHKIIRSANIGCGIVKIWTVPVERK